MSSFRRVGKNVCTPKDCENAIESFADYWLANGNDKKVTKTAFNEWARSQTGIPSDIALRRYCLAGHSQYLRGAIYDAMRRRLRELNAPSVP